MSTSFENAIAPKAPAEVEPASSDIGPWLKNHACHLRRQTMQDQNILMLTPADRAAITKWRRTMIVAVALIVAVTLGSADSHRRLAPLFAVEAASAQSRAPVMSRECVLRDAQYLMQLEEQGHRPGASGDKLYGALLAMLEARTLCQTGRTKESLALYDDAFGAFAPSKDLPATRGQAAQASAD